MPGSNDGTIFEETVRDLMTLYPSLISIAVVPVGLTSHRKNLPLLHPATPSYARKFLHKGRKMQSALRKSFDANFLFLSDEFYLLAGEEPPSYSGYDDIPQRENGVGMVAHFYRGFKREITKLTPEVSPSQKIALVTAPLGKMVLERFVQHLRLIKGLKVKILVVKNRLFGPRVTVSGLMAGRDVLDRILQNPDFDLYLLPENCLNPDHVFLDNLSFEDLKKNTGACIQTAPSSAKDIISMIIKTVPSWHK
jgi:NifB/MoaA-like Fe-S oxidoreductase